MNWIQEKENLTKLIVEDKIAYEEIGRMYGCSGTNIKKVAKRLQIPLEPRRIVNECETFNKKKRYCLNCGMELDSNRKYCNSKCQCEFEYKTFISKWKSKEIPGYGARFKLSPYIKKYLLIKHNYSCEKCGCNWTNPYTNLSILQIHHIDGDASNTNEENLQVLCPNCHSMTENFGSRNENSVRIYRKEEYAKEK